MEEIVAEPPITIAGVTLILVTRVSRYRWQAKAGAFAFGDKIPVAVVLPRENKAFRITGEEVPIEELIKEAPEIKGMLG